MELSIFVPFCFLGAHVRTVLSLRHGCSVLSACQNSWYTHSPGVRSQLLGREPGDSFLTASPTSEVVLQLGHMETELLDPKAASVGIWEDCRTSATLPVGSVVSWQLILKNQNERGT